MCAVCRASGKINRYPATGARQIKRINAVAAIKVIVTGINRNRIVACTGINHIVRGITGDGVITIRRDHIFKAGNAVRASGIAACRTIGQINCRAIGRRHIKRIGPVTTRKRIIADTGHDRIVTGTARDDVIPGSAIKDVVIGTPIDIIGTRTAQNIVRTVTAKDDVITVIGPQGIVTGTAINRDVTVGMRFTGQVDNIVTRTGIDVFNIHNRRVGGTATGVIAIQNDGIITVACLQGIVAFATDKTVIRKVFATDIGNVTGAIRRRAADMVGGFTRCRDMVPFEGQDIVTGPTVKQICSGATGKGVVPCTARKGVITRTTRKDVIAIRSQKGVVARSTGRPFDIDQGIVAIAGGAGPRGKINHNRICPIRIIGDIGAIATDKGIIAGTCLEGIVTRPAQNGVIATTTGQHIITGTAFDHVVGIIARNGIGMVGTDHGFKPVNHIISGTTGCRAIGKVDGNAVFGPFVGQRVIAFAANQGIVAAIAINGIIACAAIQDIGVFIADQDIVAIPADDIFDAIKGIVSGCASCATCAEVNGDTFGCVGIIGGIVTVTAIEFVITGPTGQGIIARITIDDIIPGTAINNIVTVKRIDFIAKLAALQDIVKFGTFDGDIAKEIIRPQIIDRNTFKRDAFTRAERDNRIAIGVIEHAIGKIAVILNPVG